MTTLIIETLCDTNKQKKYQKHNFFFLKNYLQFLTENQSINLLILRTKKVIHKKKMVLIHTAP